jgi:hypothetical protein
VSLVPFFAKDFVIEYTESAVRGVDCEALKFAMVAKAVANVVSASALPQHVFGMTSANALNFATRNDLSRACIPRRPTAQNRSIFIGMATPIKPGYEMIGM